MCDDRAVTGAFFRAVESSLPDIQSKAALGNIVRTIVKNVIPRIEEIPQEIIDKYSSNRDLEQPDLKELAALDVFTKKLTDGSCAIKEVPAPEGYIAPSSMKSFDPNLQNKAISISCDGKEYIGILQNIEDSKSLNFWYPIGIYDAIQEDQKGINFTKSDNSEVIIDSTTPDLEVRISRC